MDSAAPDTTTKVHQTYLRHSQYYFKDGSVVFLVENTLFKVHMYWFESSVLFRDMFSLPQGSKDPEGQTEENPIKLDGVKVTDFVCLCRVFYPTEPCSKFTASFKDWVAIFELASRFLFDNLRSIAMRELKATEGHTIEKILLARRYDIEDWLISLYTSLCQQTSFISKDEANLLGFETVFSLVSLRESYRMTANQNIPCKSCGNNVSRAVRSYYLDGCGHNVPVNDVGPYEGITEAAVRRAFSHL